MNINGLRLWSQARCSARSQKASYNCVLGKSRRKYATHRNNNSMDFGEKSQLLSESLDTKRRSEAKHEHVGPFQLGLSASTLRNGEKVKKWSELSTGGKGASYLPRRSNIPNSN